MFMYIIYEKILENQFERDKTNSKKKKIRKKRRDSFDATFDVGPLLLAAVAADAICNDASPQGKKKHNQPIVDMWVCFFIVNNNGSKCFIWKTCDRYSNIQPGREAQAVSQAEHMNH